MTLVLNGTTGVSAVDGSASTPAIQGNDSNTGMFFPAADTIAFAEGGTEVMRIDSSGNLGLGATPSAWASGDTVIQIKAGSGTGSFWGRNGTIRTITNGYFDGTDYRYTASSLGVSLYECSSGTHVWSTAASGTAGNTFTPTERARIDSSGNFLVGTTDPSAAGIGFKVVGGRPTTANAATTNATTTYEAYSTGVSAYRFYVGYGGTIFATSTTISAISDIRFKENVRDLDAGLAQVMALKPRLYDWKEGKGADIKNARGFIAQEFETVFPDLIDEWKDPVPEGEEPYKSVRADLIPVLVKAIQEQQALITSLTARIAALEGAAS
jgi:hypothetical protein